MGEISLLHGKRIMRECLSSSLRCKCDFEAIKEIQLQLTISRRLEIVSRKKCYYFVSHAKKRNCPSYKRFLLFRRQIFQHRKRKCSCTHKSVQWKAEFISLGEERMCMWRVSQISCSVQVRVLLFFSAHIKHWNINIRCERHRYICKRKFNVLFSVLLMFLLVIKNALKFTRNSIQ